MKTSKGRTPVTRRRPNSRVRRLYSPQRSMTPAEKPKACNNAGAAWEALPVVLTVSDAACLLRISSNSCYELLQTSDLRECAVRVGAQWRFSRDRVRAFLEGQQ